MTSQRYRPLYKLDAGGMAEVYVAEAESMAGFKKKVAIKRILPGLIKDQRFVRMFLDEARLSLRLAHANIVSVFDIGESDSTYFIVMDFVHGINMKTLLEHQVKRGGPMPVALTVFILNEVLKGLAYAHRLTDSETGRPLGIIHRDISPPNILISWNGEVKLTDFGLAKATTQLESTDPGVVKGKYSYLSPEAARAEEIDARADLYAAGILGFEMLTGRRLFRGKNDYETIALVRAGEVPSIRQYNPQVPEDLEQVLFKALHKDISQRYQTADDFAEALLGFLFTHRLKVSARDLIDFCRPVREEQEAERRAAESKAQQERSPGGNNLIINLINEEMLHFRSLGQEDKKEAAAGAQPVVAIGEAKALDPSQPLDVDVFTPAPTGVTPNRLALSPTPTEPLPDKNEPSLVDQLGLGKDSPRPKTSPSAADKLPKRPPPGNRTIPPDPRTARPPEPTNKGEGGSAWIIVLVLLLVGGGVVAFLVLT
ncbi:serine/threonine protein kinase [Nannocystis exedens]|uniref:Serine/threonine protein kinase n=1 Tax=Nannocystis exedens TaxID=54 RepID=A0A1I1X8F0_9BACT|nr:serine/threonine-protein kinase [Nannocystis exedens]PCC70744.1 serine/threonine protein kinase [Nannocystis exedens]SFE03695.1 serine/threonine protein kinase [Nannocystis exedens]